MEYGYDESRVYQKNMMHGEGIYALQNLDSGQIVLSGKITEVLRQRTKYTIEIDHDKHIIAEKKLSMVNHSCAPNVIVSVNDSNIFFVAIRPIQKDEQICFDYETTESHIMAFENCECGAENCRKTLIGLSKRKETLFKIYPKAYFMSHHVDND